MDVAGISGMFGARPLLGIDLELPNTGHAPAFAQTSITIPS